MGYVVKFNHPGFPKDEEFDITGVGLVKNGGSVKLDEDAERSFVAATGESVKDYFKDNEMIEVTGTTELKAEEAKTLTEGGES